MENEASLEAQLRWQKESRDMLLRDIENLKVQLEQLKKELEAEREVVDSYSKMKRDRVNDDGELIGFGTFDNGKRARQRIKERGF